MTFIPAEPTENGSITGLDWRAYELHRKREELRAKRAGLTKQSIRWR